MVRRYSMRGRLTSCEGHSKRNAVPTHILQDALGLAHEKVSGVVNLDGGPVGVDKSRAGITRKAHGAWLSARRG